MKNWITAAAVIALSHSAVLAIPQDFGGFGGGGLFGAAFQPLGIANDLTDELIAAALADDGRLPREWKALPSLDGDEIRIMTVTGPLFGSKPEAIFANYEGDQLKSISARYLDASHFAYKHKDLDEKTRARELKKRYARLSDQLTKELSKFTRGRGEKTMVGRTKFLRTHFLQYQYGEDDELTLRLSLLEDQSISLTLQRSEIAGEDYLDQTVAALDTRERREQLLANVNSNEAGDVTIAGIPMFKQGQRPYCSVSTLGMATHYLGLRMNTNALAAGAQFRASSTAKGAKIHDLYRAAADECGATIARGGSFDFTRAQKAIEKGYPVLVWRYYSRSRDRMHSSAALGHELVELNDDDRTSWPTGEGDPGHASVITGFNKERGEVIFMESWGEHTRGKRMKAEELEATSYQVFYFKI